MKKKIFFWSSIILGTIVIFLTAFVFSVNYLYDKYTTYDRVFALGEKYFEQGEYEKAIESFKQALPDRNWHDIELQIMRSYKKLDQSNEEIKFLEERLNDKPDQLFDFIRLYRIGEIYQYRLNDLASAKHYYELSTGKYKDPASFFGLSQIYEQEGDIPRAIAIREEGLKQMTLVDNPELAKNKAKRLNELGNLYVKVNHIDDAKNAFQEALRLDPQNFSAQETLKKLSN